MDFNQYDSRAAADEGRWLHLKHPSEGKVIYDNPEDPFEDNGKPCRVFVYGAEGRSIQGELKKIVSEILAEEGEEEGDEKEKSIRYSANEDQQERLVRLTRPLVGGFENIDRGDHPAKVPNDVDWFLNLQLANPANPGTTFAEQVSIFSTRRGSYLGNSHSSSAEM